MADDNLLDPSEIDALLQSAGSGAPTDSGADAPSPPANEPAAEMGGMLDASEIDALLAQSTGGDSPAPVAERTEALLNQAESDLAAAVAPSLNPSGNLSASTEVCLTI